MVDFEVHTNNESPPSKPNFPLSQDALVVWLGASFVSSKVFEHRGHTIQEVIHHRPCENPNRTEEVVRWLMEWPYPLFTNSYFFDNHRQPIPTFKEIARELTTTKLKRKLDEYLDLYEKTGSHAQALQAIQGK
jgi:hypothetical protein